MSTELPEAWPFVLIVVFHKFLSPEQLPNCSWDKFGVKVETGSFYIYSPGCPRTHYVD